MYVCVHALALSERRCASVLTYTVPVATLRLANVDDPGYGRSHLSKDVGRGQSSAQTM